MSVVFQEHLDRLVDSSGQPHSLPLHNAKMQMNTWMWRLSCVLKHPNDAPEQWRDLICYKMAMYLLLVEPLDWVWHVKNRQPRRTQYVAKIEHALHVQALMHRRVHNLQGTLHMVSHCNDWPEYLNTWQLALLQWQMPWVASLVERRGYEPKVEEYKELTPIPSAP